MDGRKPGEPPDAAPEVIRCDLSGDFAAWMAGAGGSVALTTYQAGKVVMVGWDGARVTLLPRHFERPMGLDVQGGRLLLATRRHLHILADSPSLAHDFLEDQPGRYDALYLPRLAYQTEELNTHDVAFGLDGPWMVNTRFSCLASPDVDHSFIPRWRPTFVSAIAPEDRCHLNGLAMEAGRPRFVTALGATDEPGGWRAGKVDGGILIDVPTGEIVLRGLCMPHSPRLHDGHLWLLNSGAGELWRVDSRDFRAEAISVLPGFLRGLCLVGHYALVGLCKLREKSASLFGHLPIRDRYPQLLCALAVVDLRDGREVGRLDFTEGCTEVFDVRFLPGVQRPMILNPDHAAAHNAFPIPGGPLWLRPIEAGVGAC
jgi:uncharacterized protein (TIGR03032 family)